MRVCLVNPPWSFEGSIYFGCREPHLPLELGYTKALLEREGHEALLIDAHMDDLSQEDVRLRVEAFEPEMTVVTTAPTYLFWRCAPPELRVPQETIEAIRPHAGTLVAVGPHGSTTPRAALRKLAVDTLVMGECEEVVTRLANGADRAHLPGVAFRHEKMESGIKVNGGPQAAKFTDLPALAWPDAWVQRHTHHHHRFDREPCAPGAEVEASRGCPFSCSFCAKENFRDKYRKRDLPTLMAEIDRLIGQGVEYLYFVDEIFLPDKPLLDALVERDVEFGIQTRLDLWKFPMIEHLGKAGCVSIEAGVESITPEGRAMLDKNCKLGTGELTERLIHAKKFVPFVQANLIELPTDDPAQVDAWREVVRSRGIWANDPVPLFPYPGSPDYRKLFGPADERAWERAMDYYLDQFVDFSDIQEDTPLPLSQLERRAAE